ncbi:RIP metalloprotease RseP [Undibacterium terreum]|uniref:Zinc metalloprotease n=1 Tax=Undibacterium terreum TaxID=1224302 RepID=A0A916UWP3_9BURK|nr:RIP metalloprotease RseP [Undibacterium terreum]GGC91381.1 zinc metalloprotease [Undibacterium terreum]
MMLLQTIIAFLVALGTLVVFHELGHYTVARLCGVKVLRFSVGMGKVIYSRKFGADQTEWAISILPLGGYVKMLDAREQDLTHLPEKELAREFCRQSVWKRIAIVAAGPIANFLLAIALFSGLYLHGVPETVSRIQVNQTQTAAYEAGLRSGDLVTAVNQQPVLGWSDLRWKLMELALEKATAEVSVKRANSDRAGAFDEMTLVLPLAQLSSKDLEGDFLSKLGVSVALPRPTLVDVLPDGAGMRAGLKAGDVILAIDGKNLANAQEFTEAVRAAPGRTLGLEVRRGSEALDIDAVPEAYDLNGTKAGRLQVQMAGPEMTVVQTPLLPSLNRGIQKTWDTSIMTFKMLGKMLTGEVSWKNITGPITIADYAGQTSRSGAISYISFIALISISLGVMNLLPIPVLDGGHLLYYSLEVLTGKPISERFGEIAQRAGVALLMTLMALAFFNDIVRLVS